MNLRGGPSSPLDDDTDSSSFSRAFSSSSSSFHSSGSGDLWLPHEQADPTPNDAPPAEATVFGIDGAAFASRPNGGRRVVVQDPALYSDVEELRQSEEELLTGTSVSSSVPPRGILKQPPPVPLAPVLVRVSSDGRSEVQVGGSTQLPPPPLTETAVSVPTAEKPPPVLSPTSPAEQTARERSVSSLLEKRPVNAERAMVIRSLATHSSGRVLTGFQKLKLSVQQRLYRRFYDLWKASLTERRTVLCKGTQTPSRRVRWDWESDDGINNDVESYDGASLVSGGNTPAAAGVPLGSASPIVALPARETPTRPLFSPSPAPPVGEGIAARSRPAHLVDYGVQADHPLRKSHSLSRGPNVALPSVVACPLRVYRTK